MPKSKPRTYSRYSHEAVALLGSLIREARKKRRMTAQEVADRAGISRGLLQRIEKGDMQCGVGATFEVAAVVGIALFDADESGLTMRLAQAKDTLSLLPKSIRQKSKAVHDDF